MWKFWIDVGGTFTDGVVQSPAGELSRHKVLSSGVVKGAIAADSSVSQIVAPTLAKDRPGFWAGYLVRSYGAAGVLRGEALVAHSQGCVLSLANALSAAACAEGTFELASSEEAPILLVRQALGLALSDPLPPLEMRLGTTRGTNALLTRAGARVAFVTTRGFGDALLIGYQNRPHLFALNIEKPAPLFSAVVEIDERLTPHGEVLVALDRKRVREQLLALKAQGIESLAICLLHAYAQPQHELVVEQVAREVGFVEVSVSHRVAPLIKLVARGDTTVVDAYLNPVLRTYLARLQESLGTASTLRVLTSAGSLVRGGQLLGKDSLLSGPAGGVVGFSRAAQAAGFSRAIGFDMGGTSTDVALFDGGFTYQYETEKAGVRIVAPMLAIETVAAGGGSICGYDAGRLTVGPASAGAEPGPACYGRGGPLAITDCNFFLGRIRSERFPFPLAYAAAEARLRAVAEALAQDHDQILSLAELAQGYLQIANTHMAQAIRSISTAAGYDVREYVLVAFGGAAPQHACAVAEILGMTKVLLPRDAGVLSACGIGLADVVRHRMQGVYLPWSTTALAELEAKWQELENEAVTEVAAEGFERSAIEVTRSLDVRYQGTDAAFTLPYPTPFDLPTAFADEHRRRFGFVQERPLEIVTLRVEATGKTDAAQTPSRRAEARTPQPFAQGDVAFSGEFHSVPLYERGALVPGDTIRGPAVVLEEHCTTVIEPGWTAELFTGGELFLTHELRAHASTAGEAASSGAAAIEVFQCHVAAIAEQMGITLRNTSSSVNVKERLDFSCAVFTAAGDLIVNAPHIPVHLGAMSETVRRVLADMPDMRPGDVLITNDPFRGGSHLPDVTVVTPVFDVASGERLFFTASRAHHAEIGGVAPGSMPPFSRSLAEEGVLIRCRKLVDAGESKFDELRDLLLAGPLPTRNVHDNLADVAAQVAANRQGARDLLALVARLGSERASAFTRALAEAAARKVRAALARFEPKTYTFREHLDDGTPILLTATIHSAGITLDFTGTGGVHPGNLNANRAIVSAAVMYVLRALVDEEIPLNQGVIAPVELIVPEGLLNPPERSRPEECAAVVGGNVETSQRVVDTLLGALGIAAASQGTMNTLLFGDSTFG